MNNLALTTTCCAALILGGGVMIDHSDAMLLPPTTTTTPTTRKISYPQHADSRRRTKSSSVLRYDFSNNNVDDPTSDETRPTTTLPPKENDIDDDDTTMIKSAQQIINNYTPGTFHPHPLFSNSHVQTIVGGLFRTSTMYWDNDNDNLFTVLSRIASKKESNTDDNHNPDDTFIAWDERERIMTPDNDFFDVTWKYSPVGIPRRGTVVLTHGLESGSDMPLSRDLATAYHLQGFDVAYINFRGCSGQPNLTPGAYHLSFTNDLQYFLTFKKSKLKKNGPIFLSGFSLGANVVVNFLAQAGNSITTTYNVHGAAVNSCTEEI